MLRIFAIVLAILLALVLVYLLLIRCRRGHKGLSQLQGWCFAHRGLHGPDAPENSMLAFQRAIDAGYGVELDVHLLADGGLAVMHDFTLRRTTGKDGYLKELTTPQLSEHFLAGTDQTIPEFTEVLKLFDGKVPLIIELKYVGNNYKKLCENVCKALEGYKGVYCMECFDPRSVRWLRKNRPDIIRGQLVENYLKTKPITLPIIVRFALGNLLSNFLTVPDFVACRYQDRNDLSTRLCSKFWGVQSVTWTIKNPEQLETSLKENRIPIFEDFCP